MATDNFWGKFRHWRRRRPFWGGLLLLLSGVELFLSGNMSIGGLEVHLGPTGFLSYLLPLILVVCSLLVWFNPTQRLFYAIVALLAALYSFIGLNLGGFFIGMLLGIFGGGLVIAWGPPRPRPGAEISGPPTGEPGDHSEDGPIDVGDDIFGEPEPHDPPTEQIEVAGHDDRPPHPQQDQQPIRPAGLIADPPRAEKPRAAGLQRLARNPRARALALIPVAVTATIVVAGSNLPASADETCPPGLPSASATTTAAQAAAATRKKTTTSKATTSKATTPKTNKTETAKTTSAAPSASASAAENPILGGIKGVIDGVGNLLGIGDDSSASPSTSPSPSESTTAPAADPATTAPAEPTTAPAATATSGATAGPATTTATAAPTASGDVIPCLGPRIYGKVAGPDDIPTVAKKPGVMEVDSLTLYNSTYDGVVDMPTDGGGSYKALKFSMDKAVNKPFKLTIDEQGGHQTVITSKELTTTGTVKFYTTELKGKLFGLIPVTFTPDAPPPLTLPVLWFTDVTVQLAFVRCDTLTGDPLKIDG